jgi:hypothetical protein
MVATEDCEGQIEQLFDTLTLSLSLSRERGLVLGSGKQDAGSRKYFPPHLYLLPRGEKK